MRKEELRREIKMLRKKMTEEAYFEKSKKIFISLINSEEYKNANVIYAYASINNEVYTKDIIEYSLNQGKQIALPKIENGIMNFYKINSLDELESGYFNVLEPVNNVAANTPDLIIVPGVAFSYRMERLGYGGGFYDRFLKEDVMKIGIAFDFQIYDRLPVLPHDIPVDKIITDKEIIIR